MSSSSSLSPSQKIYSEAYYESKHRGEDPTRYITDSLPIEPSPNQTKTLLATSVSATPPTAITQQDLDKIATLFKTVATSEECFQAALEACKKRQWQLLKSTGETLKLLVNASGHPLLISLIDGGEFELARELVEENITLHASDTQGNTALHYALIKLNMHILPKITFHDKENYFRMTPSDYIKNNMKAYFHIVRNNKVNSIEPSKLSFLVEIYKKYVSAKSETKREFATHKNIVAVNKYILNSIPEGISSIPDELVI